MMPRLVACLMVACLLVACLVGVACLLVACLLVAWVLACLLVLVAWVPLACLVGPVGASKVGHLAAHLEAGHQAHRDGQRNRRPPFSSRPCSAQL